MERNLMPLLRYFVFVGGALLALLFAVSGFMPAVPAAEASKSTTDLSIIRIHSDQKWPERVVFDTTRPTAPVPSNLAAPVVAEAIPPQNSVAALSPKVRVREAFAQLPPNPNEFSKPKPKRNPERKSVAKNYVGPPTMLVAQQPHAGLFGNNIW
jgi:hypothetical protein